DIFAHQSLQMPFIEHDHVVRQVAAAASYPTLCDSILPRTAKRGANRFSPLSLIKTSCSLRMNDLQRLGFSCLRIKCRPCSRRFGLNGYCEKLKGLSQAIRRRRSPRRQLLMQPTGFLLTVSVAALRPEPGAF